jgi:flagellar biosynthesis/type III secretory pathway protein FliH
MNTILERRGAQAVAPPAIARVEIIADASLGKGDCLVDGDLVTVDGRIQARIEELHRALETGNYEENK